MGRRRNNWRACTDVDMRAIGDKGCLENNHHINPILVCPPWLSKVVSLPTRYFAFRHQLSFRVLSPINKCQVRHSSSMELIATHHYMQPFQLHLILRLAIRHSTKAMTCCIPKETKRHWGFQLISLTNSCMLSSMVCTRDRDPDMNKNNTHRNYVWSDPYRVFRTVMSICL
jgi:hypothetical protein